MPTYAWNPAQYLLRDKVLRKLGVIGESESGSPGQASVVQDAMNSRMKELHTLGVLWWDVAAAQTPLTLTANTSTATVVSEDFLYPLTASIDVAGEQEPLEIISHAQYQAIPDKARTGQPEQVHFSGSVGYFWPVPSTAYTARLTYQAIAENVDPTTRIDMPAAALRAFVDLVAGDLVDDFGLDSQRAARLVAKQPQAMRTLRMVAYQRVDSALVTPEYF
jgi:hypothetical protein